MPETVTISLARFEELLRAERDSVILKGMIETKNKAWDGLSRDEMKLLYNLYFYPDEENEE